jgi:hypothetical protein
MTAAEKLTEEDRKQGLAQGHAESLLKLLSLRFGPLPEAATQRIQSASIAELDGLAERMLSAETLDEALA